LENTYLGSDVSARWALRMAAFRSLATFKEKEKSNENQQTLHSLCPLNQQCYRQFFDVKNIHLNGVNEE
jgi:hypothetical protein